MLNSLVLNETEEEVEEEFSNRRYITPRTTCQLGALSYLLWKWLLDGPLGGNESLHFQDLRYFLKLERLVGASIGSSQ
ncbi:unnamed protein product [Brassica oleracea var. botrytis]